jgi:hypothetical protein
MNTENQKILFLSSILWVLIMILSSCAELKQDAKNIGEDISIVGEDIEVAGGLVDEVGQAIGEAADKLPDNNFK